MGRVRRRRRWPLVVGVVAMLGAAAAGWFVLRPPRGPRLVIVYASCTVNRGFLSPYDATVTYTPAFERFARDGAVFTRHQTEEGQSGIAFASLLTGNQAPRHGVYYHPTRLTDDLYLMTEAFRDAGYHTYFWSAHPMTSKELNYAQGVEPADAIYSPFETLPPNEQVLRADDPRFQAILHNLVEHPRERAFIFATLTFTHAPYLNTALGEFCAAHAHECAGFTPQGIDRYSRIYWANFLRLQFAWDETIATLGLNPKEAERLIAVIELLYRSSVYWLDRRFGELVDAIDAAGLRDDALIVFTADHGEQMEWRLADMRWTHGFALTAEDTVVPWIVRGPGVRPGRVEAVTRSIDVFPTVAGLAGVALPPGGVEGADLAPVLRGEQPPPHLLAFMHSTLLPDGMQPDSHAAILQRFPRRDPALMWTAVRDGDLVYKLTDESGTGTRFVPHVYDWSTDPGERTDLYDPNDPEHAAMLKRLGAYKGALSEGYSYWQAVAEGRVPSEQQREIMRSLGYID